MTDKLIQLKQDVDMTRERLTAMYDARTYATNITAWVDALQRFGGAKFLYELETRRTKEGE